MIVEELKQLLENIPNDYEIAFEVIRNPEEDDNCKDDILIGKDSFDDGLGWEFVKSHCMGCYTLFNKEKVLGLQIHY